MTKSKVRNGFAFFISLKIRMLCDQNPYRPLKEFFLKSMKRPSSLPMQISTRYLQFRQSAGIGKLSGG
jgi:hypothetical protein